MQPTYPAPTAAVVAPRTVRKRVLIVNVFFDEYRRTTGSPYRVPQAMAPCFLAGAFSARACDLRIYNEQYSGVLRDPDLLAWPTVPLVAPCFRAVRKCHSHFIEAL